MTPAFTVRPERAEDVSGIRRVHDAAFGQRDESHIVDVVRHQKLMTCSLVSVTPEGVVGHILFTPVSLGETASESSVRAPFAAGLGPMAVSPAHQRQGAGSALVRAGLDACAATGVKAVVVVGHPTFYPRFGFRPGRAYGLSCEFPVPDDVFMALELVPGSLGHGRGVVYYCSAFRGPD
jgi:putative acetyltransferase